MFKPVLPVLMMFAACSMPAAAGTPASPVERLGELAVGVGYPVARSGMRQGTPETLEALLAQELGQRLQVPVTLHQVSGTDGMERLNAGRVDLLVMPSASALPSAVMALPSGYSVAPMAIMRSDTGIRQWQQLKGRKVCVVAHGRYHGIVALRYGAQEIAAQAFPEALLALRTGGCDAMVHDDIVLEQLLKQPEWKKFSARLSSEERVPLVFIVRAADRHMAEWLQRELAQRTASRNADSALAAMVHQIAYEVYLQQEVPDCH